MFNKPIVSIKGHNVYALDDIQLLTHKIK